MMGLEELAVVGLVGSGIGTALGVPLAWPRARRPVDLGLLGLALILMSAIAGLISARLAGLLPASAAVEHGINLIGLAAYPVALIYTRHAAGSPEAFRHVGALGTPAAAYLLYVLSCAALGRSTRVPFAWLLPVVLGFTAWSAAVLWRGRTTRSGAIVGPEWVVGFLIVLNAAQIVRMDFSHVPALRALVPLVLSGGFVAMVGFVAWRTAAPHEAPATAEPPRYERSALDGPAAQDLLGRIERAFGQERLFARTDLTLADLAASVGSTPHQVSEALNRYAGTSFRDLLNRRRVDDVKRQLLDASSNRFTIEGIGATAGFGSRSALYAAFRRLEGMTPAEFRESRHADGTD